jgi:hypothetical protein
LLEILKLVVSILCGGAAGALLNEWFRRRKGKVQPISLVERVNRSVSPELEGITLARMVGGVAVKLVSPSLRLACDFQRVNFEVINLKPFACLAFPLSLLRENSLVLVTTW